VTIFVPPLVTEARDVAAAISQLAQNCGHCTLAAVFMTGDGVPAELASGAVQVPGYEFPEDAARAVALAARHGVWRRRPAGAVPSFDDCRIDEAAAIISEELGRGASWLARDRLAALLHCYGLPLAHELQGFVVPPMTPAGVEMIVGVVHDESFGPVLACGAGGTNAGLIQDVAVRITPLTDLDAGEMVRSLKTFPLLDGYRGAPPCDGRRLRMCCCASAQWCRRTPRSPSLIATR